jgi:hypothetical protein
VLNIALNPSLVVFDLLWAKLTLLPGVVCVYAAGDECYCKYTDDNILEGVRSLVQ